MLNGSEKSYCFSHIEWKDCRVFSDLAKYRMCLSFVFPKYARVEISSYRIVLMNFFLSELIKVYAEQGHDILYSEALVLWFHMIRNADKEGVLYLVGFQGDINRGTKLITLLDNVINFVRQCY